MKDFRRQTSDVDRRSFLRNALTAAGIAAVGGVDRLAALPLLRDIRQLPPIRVARNRIIREIVGLRPYRPIGYRVEAERMGNKIVIHNYGHGGAGITLSWGTATQAVELLKDIPVPLPPTAPRARPRRFAVIGSGVNGLSTARMLQRRYADGSANVTIYARDLPPDTTSNIAAGYWSPVSLYDYQTPPSAKFMEQFRAASRIANRAYQIMVGADYGVRWIDVFTSPWSEDDLRNELPGGNDLYPDQAIHREPAKYFGLPYVRQFKSMMIEPPIYLRALMRDFYNAGGKIIVKEFRSREEVLRLQETVIFNCSGLGAGKLFGDDKLTPARGQLEVLLPQPEIDYGYITPSGHMFPRSDGIFLGGTFETGDWNLNVKPEHSKQIIEGHERIWRGVKS